MIDHSVLVAKLAYLSWVKIEILPGAKHIVAQDGCKTHKANFPVERSSEKFHTLSRQVRSQVLQRSISRSANPVFRIIYQ